jgi:hypothetical protein
MPLSQTEIQRRKRQKHQRLFLEYQSASVVLREVVKTFKRIFKANQRLLLDQGLLSDEDLAFLNQQEESS